MSSSICSRCLMTADQIEEGGDRAQMCTGSKAKLCSDNCKFLKSCIHKSRCDDCKRKRSKDCKHHRLIQK